jgi:hypothetical protein
VLPRPHSGSQRAGSCISSRPSGSMGALSRPPPRGLLTDPNQPPRAFSHLCDESVACCATNKIRNCSYPDCRTTIQAATFLGSCWQASARGSPDYSSSRRCNRLVTSQAAGASSGTASRISQTVTSRGQENPLKRPAESPLSCHRRGRRMLAKSIPVKRLVDVSKSDQGSLAISINNFGDACLVIRGRR